MSKTWESIRKNSTNTSQLPLRADMVNFINNKVHHTDTASTTKDPYIE